MSKIIPLSITTTEQAVELDATYQFAWFRNIGENDVLLSDHSGIVAGDDNVTLVKTGESGRISTSGRAVYVKAVSGTSTGEIHAQNFSDTPFKSKVRGGGESITIDPTPTQGSSNAVSSGGVYDALANVSPVDYSTMEQNTGRKWIDGKPVYQKVVLLYSNGSLVSGLSITNNLISGDSIPSNIDTLIDYRGISERGASGDEGYVDNYVGMGTYGGLSYTMVPNKNNNTIYFNPYSAVKDVFIVYEYTKTTDTAE